MFHGSIVALLTPFSASGEIDLEALEKLVAFHLQAGTHALVIAGTTGESATLRNSEFSALVSAAIGFANGEVPVIAGTGSASTSHAIEQSQEAQSLGAAAVLVVTPYYNRPTQTGLAAHYEAVADAISIPLIMYNVPARTSVDLLPETSAALSHHAGIVGLKEAVADMERVGQLVRDCPADFAIISGDDPSCLEAMKRGARGVISVAANIAPAQMRSMCDFALQGDWARASSVNERLAPLFETLAVETNPIPVKWAACEMGLVGPGIRLPLTALDQKYRRAVVECLDELNISAVF